MLARPEIDTEDAMTLLELLMDAHERYRSEHDLTPADALVLYAAAHRQTLRPSAPATVGSIARETGLPLETARRRVNALKGRGLLKTQGAGLVAARPEPVIDLTRAAMNKWMERRQGRLSGRNK